MHKAVKLLIEAGHMDLARQLIEAGPGRGRRAADLKLPPKSQKALDAFLKAIKEDFDFGHLELLGLTLAIKNFLVHRRLGVVGGYDK